MFTSLQRIIKSGIFNFWRNAYVSLASIIVMSITLFVIGSVILSSVLLEHTLTELKNKVDINVYFSLDASEDNILSVKESIEQLPETQEITYQSRDEVLEEFKERHANDQVTLAALEELSDNPLGARLNIFAKNPEQYASIAEFLEGQNLSQDGEPLISRIDYNQNKAAIDTLAGVINTAERLGLILSIVVVAASVLITFNTIRLAIFISRDEIGVMRLVGASTPYIRGPFVITGILYGLVSSVLTLSVLFPVTYWFGGITESFFIGFNVYSYYLSNVLWIAGVILGSGTIIGAISSYLAVWKYIKY